MLEYLDTQLRCSALKETAESCHLWDNIFASFRQNVSSCMRYAPLLTSLPLHRRAKRDLVIRRGQYLLCHQLYTALYTCSWSTCKLLSSMKVRTFLEARTWLGVGDWCGRPGRQSPRSGKMDILNERIYYLCSTNIIEPNKRKVNKVWFLGPFTELWEATISFVICLSVHSSAWNNSAPTGEILVKLDIWGFFKNLSRKFKFH